MAIQSCPAIPHRETLMRGSGDAEVLICRLPLEPGPPLSPCQTLQPWNLLASGMLRSAASGDRGENCRNPRVVLTVAQESPEESASVINSFPISQSFSHPVSHGSSEFIVSPTPASYTGRARTHFGPQTPPQPRVTEVSFNLLTSKLLLVWNGWDTLSLPSH